MKQQQQDMSLDRVGEVPAMKVHAPTASSSTLKLLLILNLLLMGVLLLSGAIAVYHAHHSLTAASRTLDQFSKMVEHPELLAQLASSAASSWIAGKLNGSIALFAQNLLTTDIATFATEVNAFGSKVMMAFDNTPPLSCSNPVTCQQGNIYVQCNGGNTVYCGYQGQVLNCANQTCIAGQVMAVASLVTAVSANIMPYNGPAMTPSSDAALSDGLLNVANVLPWIADQVNLQQWQKLGVVCKEVTSAVKRMRFNGAYVDAAGRKEIYNSTAQVMQAVGYVDQVCNDLVTLPTGHRSSNRKAARRRYRQ